MKNFITVFNFEFSQMVKSKIFISVTAVFVLLCGLGMYSPNILDMFRGDTLDEASMSDEEFSTLYIMNDTDLAYDYAQLEQYFPESNIEVIDEKETLESAIGEGEGATGIVITGALSFEYHVKNTDMSSNSISSVFQQYMSESHKLRVLNELGLDPVDTMNQLEQTVSYEEVNYGKDGIGQLGTAMALVFLLYMMILSYGQVIATNVASEKGNRTMELLVTSTSPTALIYGKVLAGCSAVYLQGGIIIASVKVFYELNRESWGGMLDEILDIPVEVMISFALFGMFGYICYAFMFATCGAMVSKSEDVNSTLQPIMIISVLVFYAVFFGINNPEGLLLKWASFIPISSPLAMFIRMTIVEVPMIEVVGSFIILVITTIVIAWGASKMYRRATLMYGNQLGFWKMLGKKN